MDPEDGAQPSVFFKAPPRNFNVHPRTTTIKRNKRVRKRIFSLMVASGKGRARDAFRKG